MRGKHENAVYFFAILGLIIVAAVVFSPNFHGGAKVEGEGSVEVDVLSSPQEAQNLAGEAFIGRMTCSDSDGGKKYYQVGYVSGYRWISGMRKAYKYPDNCITSGTHKGELREWYCDGNTPKSVFKKCPYGCADNACKPAPKEVCTCTDSDGGKDYYTLGSATKECKGPDATSSIVLKKDECAYCTGLAPEPVTCGAVVEYYCYNNDIQSETHVCEYGCSNGACIKEPQIECTDSDSGKAYYTKGTTIGMSYPSGTIVNKTDFCSSDLILHEYYCYYNITTNIVVDTEWNCPYGCQDGACIQEQITCTDSDGEDYYTLGYVNYVWNGISETVYDNCIYWNITDPKINGYLEERVCRDGKYDTVAYTCPNGCQDGVCICPANCVCTNSATECPANQTIGCYDSDGGKDYRKKGSVSGYKDGKYTFTDICIGGSPLPNGLDPGIGEYFCYSSTFPDWVAVMCSEGCKDGVCYGDISVPKCTDSDGNNIYTKGSAQTELGTGQGDCCINQWGGSCVDEGTKIREGICKDGPLEIGDWSYTNAEYDCPNGCQDGACIKEPQIECTDSDGGVNPYVGGFCTDSRGTFYDSCLTQDGAKSEEDGAYVYEVFCLTDEMVEHCKQYNSVEYCDKLPRQCYGVSLLPTPGLAWTYFDRDEKYFCPTSCINGTCIR